VLVPISIQQPADIEDQNDRAVTKDRRAGDPGAAGLGILDGFDYQLMLTQEVVHDQSETPLHLPDEKHENAFNVAVARAVQFECFSKVDQGHHLAPPFQDIPAECIRQ